MFFPSTYPSWRSPSENASHIRTKAGLGGKVIAIMPIRYTFPACCASASGAARRTMPRAPTKVRRSIINSYHASPITGTRSLSVLGQNRKHLLPMPTLMGHDGRHVDDPSVLFHIL